MTSGVVGSTAEPWGASAELTVVVSAAGATVPLSSIWITSISETSSMVNVQENVGERKRE